MAISDNVSLKRLPKTIVDAQRIVDTLQKRDTSSQELTNLKGSLYSPQVLAKHALFLDSALDSWTKEQLRRQREADPAGFGIAIASDESPPSQPRYGGYRFQITCVYVPRLEPQETWESFDKPPISSCCLLADICHAPGKDGATVSRVIDKQIARFGCSRYDCVSGTGDGGGENEGQTSGVHHNMEGSVPGYVRRRCLGHISWTVTKAVTEELKDHDLTKRLCVYFGEGGTWRRLQILATTPVLEGGLGLMEERYEQ